MSSTSSRSSGSRRPLHAALLVAVVVAVLSPVSPARAGDDFAGTTSARSTGGYLCTGYVACDSAGYPHFGYKQASSTMWWRMYSGHNCTNYVAYRLVDRGMSAARPWNGSGMAYNWGRAKRGITDSTPMVGSVAWWDAGDGVGSSGHVAYVQKVLTRRKIVISEDSWGGDFHWRVVTRAGGRWPTGFIHFMDEEVQLVRAPAVTGTPVVGQPVTADLGAWRNAATQAAVWLADGTVIPGATGATFTPGPEHVGSRLSVRVSATARGYKPASATSPPTAQVERGEMAVAEEPALSGTPRVDETLTVQPGTASPAADSTSFRWFADGQRLPGETGPTLTLGQELIRKQVTARVVMRRAGYRMLPTTTEATPPVKAGLIEVSRPFGLSGRAERDRTLSVQPGTWSPADAEVGYTWLRDGRPVAGATGPSYVPGVDDVGHQVSVRVRLHRSGYRDESVTLAARTLVATRPTLHLRAHGRSRRAVVRLRVDAPGAPDPGGQATVRIGRRHAATAEVVNGVLRVVLRGVPAGTRRVRVLYRGTDVVTRARAVDSVRVRR